MINGYVTFNELMLITGFSEKMLEELLIQGLTFHELSIINCRRKELKQQLINLEEFSKWISTHIY